MRRAAKRDETEADIVKALVADGWEVTTVSDESVPDLLCSKRGVWMLIECKTGRRGLTKAQGEFLQRHIHGHVGICNCPEDAVLWGRFVLGEYARGGERVGEPDPNQERVGT